MIGEAAVCYLEESLMCQNPQEVIVMKHSCLLCGQPELTEGMVLRHILN